MAELVGSPSYMTAGSHWAAFGLVLHMLDQQPHKPAMFYETMWIYRRMGIWEALRMRKPFFWCTEKWKYARLCPDPCPSQHQLLLDHTLAVPAIMVKTDKLEAQLLGDCASPQAFVRILNDQSSRSTAAENSTEIADHMINETLKCLDEVQAVLDAYDEWSQHNIPSRTWIPCKWKNLGAVLYCYDYPDFNEAVRTIFHAGLRIVVLTLQIQLKRLLMRFIGQHSSPVQVTARLLEVQVTQHVRETLMWAEECLLSIEYFFSRDLGYTATSWIMMPYWHAKFAMFDAVRNWHSQEAEDMWSKWQDWFVCASRMLVLRGYPGEVDGWPCGIMPVTPAHSSHVELVEH